MKEGITQSFLIAGSFRDGRNIFLVLPSSCLTNTSISLLLLGFGQFQHSTKRSRLRGLFILQEKKAQMSLSCAGVAKRSHKESVNSGASLGIGLPSPRALSPTAGQ